VLEVDVLLVILHDKVRGDLLKPLNVCIVSWLTVVEVDVEQDVLMILEADIVQVKCISDAHGQDVVILTPL